MWLLPPGCLEQCWAHGRCSAHAGWLHWCVANPWLPLCGSHTAWPSNFVFIRNTIIPFSIILLVFSYHVAFFCVSIFGLIGRITWEIKHRPPNQTAWTWVLELPISRHIIFPREIIDFFKARTGSHAFQFLSWLRKWALSPRRPPLEQGFCSVPE